jgi:octaprenyl-diphosphate synthase
MSLPEIQAPSKSSSERFADALALIPELHQVEDTIRKAFRSDVTPMRDIPDYLLSLGGKRIRPALTLLCAKALGASIISQEIIDVAAGIELIHMATLMHDDIIDQSPIRRHKPSPYAKFGTPLTLLSGDFLLTRAFGLCAKLDDTIIAATEQACIELVEGEALETPLYSEQHTTKTSLVIAQRKTASLFRLAAFCAGHLTSTTPESLRLLSEFGESLGVAFQFIDDILDVTASEATLGKQPGIDIVERKPSIVNVLWLESGTSSAQHLLQPPKSPEEEKAFVETSLRELQASSVMLSAKSLAQQYGERARTALHAALGTETRRESPAGQALFAVIDFALDRLN